MAAWPCSSVGVYVLPSIPPFQFKRAETGNVYVSITEKTLLADGDHLFEQTMDYSLRGSGLLSNALHEIRKGYLVTHDQPYGL